MKSVLYKNEREDQHCAEIFPLNLVCLGRHQMWDKSITESHHLVNPPSNQRRINVDRVSISGGLLRPRNRRRLAITTGAPRQATSNADSYSRCFPQLDRKTDCYRNGVLELSGGFIFSLIRLSHINAVNHSSNMLCHTQSYLPQKLCQTDEKPGIFIGPNHPIKG